MYEFWIIVGASFFLAVLNFSIDRVLGVRKETSAIQKEVSDWSKAYSEAVKADDKEKIKQLGESEKQVMGKMTKMMFLPFKSALFLIPLYFLFQWLLKSNLDKNLKFILPFPVPNFNLITWDNIIGVSGLFILSLVLWGLVINLLVPAVEKLLEKKVQMS